MTPEAAGVAAAEPLIERLRSAVRLGDVVAVTGRVKADLESVIGGHELFLPARFRASKAGGYCRRLLHRDPELGFTAVVMTWAPGQRTALHDHSGIWCVEGVVEGEMEVTRYELAEESAEGLYRFVDHGSVHSRAGAAGALIPPFDYHVLANSDPERVAMTLHVYGGEMNHCSVFEPAGEGLYRRSTRTLAYDE